jgi:hypothetical protein
MAGSLLLNLLCWLAYALPAVVHCGIHAFAEAGDICCELDGSSADGHLQSVEILLRLAMRR